MINSRVQTVFLEICERAFWMPVYQSTVTDRDKPGAYYNSLPQEIKDVLKNLKSDDIKDQMLYLLKKCGQPESPAIRVNQYEYMQKHGHKTWKEIKEEHRLSTINRVVEQLASSPDRKAGH